MTYRIAPLDELPKLKTKASQRPRSSDGDVIRDGHYGL